jgi:hypothetical protein
MIVGQIFVSVAYNHLFPDQGLSVSSVKKDEGVNLSPPLVHSQGGTMGQRLE